MKIEIDKKADALYIQVKRNKVHKTVAYGNFILDLNKKKEVVGIEILNYSKTVASKPDKRYVSVPGGR